MPSSFRPGKSTLSGIAAAVSSILAIYAGMWSFGVAPVTNSQAQQMVEAQVEEASADIMLQLNAIKQNQATYNNAIVTLQSEIRELRRSGDRVDNNLQQIFDILIQIERRERSSIRSLPHPIEE